MLTGKDLGAAIKDAIEKKGVRQTEVARHFEVKPPSIQDWIKKGTIGKDKLPGLWAYFSDVVGPEHWGLAQFPQGSYATSTTIEPERSSRHVTDSQWALLQDFEILPEDDKQALRDTMHAKAENVRRIVADYLLRRGMSGTANDSRVEEAFGAPPPPQSGSTRQYTKQLKVSAGPAQKKKAV